MKEITPAITEIKAKVSMQDWQQRIIDCQSSGMSVKAWCRENRVATSSYYHYLRKIRESVLEGNSARIHWEAVIGIIHRNPHQIAPMGGRRVSFCSINVLTMAVSDGPGTSRRQNF